MNQHAQHSEKNCPSCDSHHEPEPKVEAAPKESLFPLAVIVAYLLGGVLLRASISGDFSSHTLMANFMGGFFIVFSLFKLLDLKGFAEGYSTYDLLAKRLPSWALIYPFVELLLGVAYFLGVWATAVNLTTAILMTVGAIGVYLVLRRGDSIHCACLGTTLKLPMTKVTLVEDLVMGVMAVIMLNG